MKINITSKTGPYTRKSYFFWLAFAVLTACGEDSAEQNTDTVSSAEYSLTNLVVPSNQPPSSVEPRNIVPTNSPTMLNANDTTANSGITSSSQATLIMASPSTPRPLLTNNGKIDSMNWLNYFRQLVGIQPLRENSALAAAAQKQAEYVLTPSPTNNTCDRDHVQDPDRSNFFAATLTERTIKSGFQDGFVGEVFAVYNHTNIQETIQGLIDAVYHRIGIFNDYTQIGTAQVIGKAPSICQDGFISTVAVLGEKDTRIKSNQLIAYPYHDQKNVPIDWYAFEYPTPVPVFGSLVGYPISLQAADPTEPLIVNQASLKNSQGENVSVRLLSAANDPTLAGSGGYAMTMIPNQPLKPNETYSVNVNGTINKTPMNISWQFTTLKILPVVINSTEGDTIANRGDRSSTIISWEGGTNNFQPMMYSWTNMEDKKGKMLPPVDIVQLSNRSWRITSNGNCNIPAHADGCKFLVKIWDSSKPTATPRNFSDPINPPNASLTLKVKP